MLFLSSCSSNYKNLSLSFRRYWTRNFDKRLKTVRLFLLLDPYRRHWSASYLFQKSISRRCKEILFQIWPPQQTSLRQLRRNRSKILRKRTVFGEDFRYSLLTNGIFKTRKAIRDFYGPCQELQQNFKRGLDQKSSLIH